MLTAFHETCIHLLSVCTQCVTSSMHEPAHRSEQKTRVCTREHAGCHLQSFACALQDLPHIGIHDYELVETWRLDSWSHETCGLRYNMNEVSEVRWIDIRELRPWMEREPQSFTPWFVDEAKLLGLV